MSPTIPRFSQLYTERPINLDDSAKLRKRISSYYQSNIHSEKYRSQDGSYKEYAYLIKRLIEQEIGIEVPSTFGYGVAYHIDDLLNDCGIHDFLDIISIINHALTGTGKNSSTWINFVERVFREESASYTINDKGVVGPYVDADFSKNHQSTLSILDKPRYEQVKKIYENAYISLRSDKLDTRTAVKDMFESIETLSKLLDNKIKGLSENEANGSLKSLCESAFEDKDERDFVKLMLSSFAKWVTAHHIYRHGQNKEKHTPPSLESAVLSLSSGTAFLRFLIQVDNKLNAGK